MTSETDRTEEILRAKLGEALQRRKVQPHIYESAAEALAPLGAQAVVADTVDALVAAGLPLLFWLRFDFNPMNLRSPRAESIATYTELMKDPQMNAHTAEVLAGAGYSAGEIADMQQQGLKDALDHG